MFIVAQPGTVRQLVVEDDDTSNGKRATRRGQREHDVPTTGVLDTPYMPFPRLLQSNDDTTWPVPAARTYRHLPLRSVAGNATYSSASVAASRHWNRTWTTATASRPRQPTARRRGTRYPEP